ncbi:MAG: N-6 DNA methylase [Pirellulaceae bacterium]|nr:N-6 DNA methylase [Pirellulaceae bacterium]MDP7017826.1 N-6 DNA methylase [Pirellulaceae bacterium]
MRRQTTDRPARQWIARCAISANQLALALQTLPAPSLAGERLERVDAKRLIEFHSSGAQWWRTVIQLRVFLAVRSQLQATDSPGELHDSEQLQEWLIAAAKAAGRQRELGEFATRLEEAPRDACRRWFDHQAAGDAGWPYFHEWFLSNCDRAGRMDAGAYYTPYSVAEYLLKSVSRLTAKHFPTRDRLVLLDPACGGGIFLTAAERVSWPNRSISLCGWELNPASWAIAHYCLSGDRHAIGLQCCDALEQMSVESLRPPADEALLIVGNPPYGAQPIDAGDQWRRQLVQPFRPRRERKSQLSDSFVQFLAWGKWQLDQRGAGVMAFVTNSSYLTGVTHRTTRAALGDSFDHIDIVNLHGGMARRPTPDDQNIFGIRQGIAIGVFAKTGGATREVRYAELTGRSDEKLAKLREWTATETPWRTMSENSFHIQAPTNRSGEEHWTLDRVVRAYTSGVQTKCDALLVGHTRDELAGRIRQLLNGSPTEHQPPAWLRKRLAAATFDELRIREYFVSPFDRRFVYYDPALLGRPRRNVLGDVAPGERSLIFMRQSSNAGEYDHFLIADGLASDRVFSSAHGAPFLAPLSYCGEPNVADEFVAAVRTAVAPQCEPADAFFYLYGLFHSARYRRRWAAELRRGFPPVPLPPNHAAWRKTVAAGRALADLHCSPPTGQRRSLGLRPARMSDSDMTVERVGSYQRDATGDVGAVHINDATAIVVPQALWDWSVGGYRVVWRWLTQRRGRALTDADLRWLAHLDFIRAETHRWRGQLQLRWLDEVTATPKLPASC